MNSANHSEEAGDIDSPHSSDLPRLDLKKYRTTELVDRVGQVLGITNVLWRFVKSQLWIILLAQLAFHVLFIGAEPGWGVRCFLTVFGLVCGIAFGSLLGVLRIVYDGLANVDQILELVLNIAVSAAEDYGSVRTGNKKMPSARQLIGQVYDDVVGPAISKIVGDQIPLVGAPIAWAYEKSIEAAVRTLFVRSRMNAMADAEIKGLERDAAEAIQESGAYPEKVRATVEPISRGLQGVTRGLRFYAMRPLFGLYVVLLLVAVSPVLLVRWFH